MHVSKQEEQKGLIPQGHEEIFSKLSELYQELFQHNGYGTLRIEMRFLKKGQKEIFVISGKEYRFVVDYPSAENLANQWCGAKGGGGSMANGVNHVTKPSGKEVRQAQAV
jgi:hypothetical protein